MRRHRSRADNAAIREATKGLITRPEQLSEAKPLVATSNKLCERAESFIRSIHSTSLPFRQRVRPRNLSPDPCSGTPAFFPSAGITYNQQTRGVSIAADKDAGSV